MRTEMMQFAAGDGFEAGAGFSMAENNGLLSLTLVLLLVLALICFDRGLIGMAQARD